MQQQRSMGQQVNSANEQQLIKNERPMDQCVQSSTSSQCHVKQEAEQQLPQLQQISHNLATDLYNVSNSITAALTVAASQVLLAPPTGCGVYYSHNMKVLNRADNILIIHLFFTLLDYLIFIV